MMANGWSGEGNGRKLRASGRETARRFWSSVFWSKRQVSCHNKLTFETDAK